MVKQNALSRKVFSCLLALLLAAGSVLPAGPASQALAAAGGTLITEQPALVVTGTGIVGGDLSEADLTPGVAFEKSYTRAELEAREEPDYLEYSWLNSAGTKRFYKAKGVRLETLFADTAFTNDKYADYPVRAIQYMGGAYSATLDFAVLRYFFPPVAGAAGIPVPTIVATQSANSTTGIPDDTAVTPLTNLLLLTGQIQEDDVNSALANSNTQKILVGDELPAVLRVDSLDYTRAELLMMPRAERSYTYSASGGDRTDTARGVPLADLLQDIDISSLIEFSAADGYSMTSYDMPVSELAAKNAILAYETLESTGWQGIYSTAKPSAPNPAGVGYFTLYIDGELPGKMIDAIRVKPADDQFKDSLYKHISHEGAPYNLDAITGATLTVEGPGVKASVPIPVRDVEETAAENLYRDIYSDSRPGGSVQRIYEGVTLQSVLDGRINSQVECMDDGVVVVFKNRWRQEIGRMSYAEIRGARTPVILAYGTANADGTNIRPFVFIQAAGEDTTLGNGDGPLKLVYDQNEFPALASVNGRFGSVAYLYVEEGVPPPGYKHSESTDSAYSNKTNTEYLVTFTGDAIGREVSYTVDELEDMVLYEGDKPLAGGLGHRDEYSLSNTTYWYVNEYEGVKLWDLLTTIGVDAEASRDDEETLVSFSAWDNYQVTAQFSLKQLADPDLFYFYEKSPLDIGTDRPAREQLATEEYQPDNQGEDWTTDDNGYPVKKGYPVLLAYGVNGYPYVRDASMSGFKSGLGNDGGPMRVIYGKTDGLNRTNPDALENYAYFFNNGSQQLQRVQEVYAGNPVRYSTHLENPDEAYQAMKDQPALAVEILSAGSTQTHHFTLAELESILYGAGVSKRDRDTENRQEKGYYFHKVTGFGDIEDLFEGINLEYLLTEHIGMQGSLGTMELYSGDSEAPSAVYSLADLGQKGYNSLRDTGNLGMMVAFAKNGYPLVEGGGTTPGYISTDPVTAKDIKNNGGPLQFVRAQTEAEADAGILDVSDGAKTSVENLTRIVVHLEPDAFAHAGAAYEDYANQTIRFSGAVALENGVNIKAGVLETMQKYMVTGVYTIDGQNHTYRGLDLLRLLSDKAIGASALMDSLRVIGESGEIDLSVADLSSGEKKVILAYGMAGAEDISDAGPLTAVTGGPLRLIIDGGTAADCIANVSEIQVSAADVNAWKHNFGVFQDYAGFTLEISGQNLAYNKTFTIAELEAMENIFLFDAYQMGGTVYVQGIDLYKLLQGIGFAENLDTSAFTANSIDNFPISFSGTDLKNGVNGKPILVAFGQGPSQDSGLPLVPDANAPGYDANIGNAGGPLRLIVNDNTGWCVRYLNRIVVGAAGGNTDPGTGKDFSIYGLPGGTAEYDIRMIKNLPDGIGQKMESYSYTSGGTLVTDTVKGAYLYDLLKANGVSDTATVTVNTSDAYETSQADYREIPMSEIRDRQYFVAYDAGPDQDNLGAVSDDDRQSPPVTATVRIYRNFNDGSNWRNRLTNVIGVTVEDYLFTSYPGGKGNFPEAGVRSVSFDPAGGMWVGTYGGGIAYLPEGADAFTVYNTAETSPVRLLTNFASAAAMDSEGGLWFSQNASYTEPGNNRGAGYLKDGGVVWYDTQSAPGTIPDNYVQAIEIDEAGNVWFGSFGGLTKYDGVTWRTWTKAEGLPAESVNTIVSDGEGGVWVGCYPDTAGSVEIPGLGSVDTYSGGYAHVAADGTVFAKIFDGTNTEPYMFADFWVRGIAADDKGGAWIVRAAGANIGLPSVGGRVDYVNRDHRITSYTGKELLGEEALNDPVLAPEIRVVTVDAKGGLWFGTSGAGLFHCPEPGNVNRVYDTASGAWPAGTPMDNIYYLGFRDDALYVGSSGGIAWAEVELSAPVTPGDQEDAYTLVIDDSSGTEKRIVLTGPVVPTASEKVYTESELKEKFAADKEKGDLFQITMMNTFPSKRLYTLRGISLWDVFADAGIGPEIYRNPAYYLQTVSLDNFTVTIGEGVTIGGQGELSGLYETGTLDAPRYTYPIEDFWNADPLQPAPGAAGVEIPWYLSFAESYQALTVPSGMYPADGTDTSQALRPYFGQLQISYPNLPLSGSSTFRLVLSDSRLSSAQAKNNPDAYAFYIAETGYDRANILTGPDGKGDRIRGHFIMESGDTVWFAGTSAASLLQAAVNPLNDKDYFSFTNAAGEQVIESYAAIRSGQYTLVYETGMAADHMEAIDRSVGGASFYFDLYRDGQPVISNVSGINHAAPPAVDKAELQILVIKARAMENTGYPQDVWEYFRSVLSTAETVLAAEEADQPQIDDARNLLAAAIEAMEDLAIDKSELQALIDAAESLENKGYPAGLWADFQTALQAARSILDNAYATKAQEYAARVDLWEAMAAIDAVETGGFHGECLSLNPGMTERDLGFSWYSDWEEQAASYVRIARKDAMNGGVFPDVYLSVSGETGNASTGKIWHTAEVSGLAPDTEYVYRVSNDGLRYSEVYSFKTGGAGDFRFIAVGDPQVDGGFQDEFSFYTPVTTAEGWADTVNRAVQHVPDARLIASVGDQVEAGSNEVLWTDFFAPPALRSLPLALTAGNHDSGENLDWHFCTPGNQTSGNYWFKYGNAFFVVLDTSGRADASTIGEYITRFDATLEAAAEARSDTDWLFIIHHKSTASPGAHRNEADVRAFAAAIEDLADKYHVDFVLAGHDHLYSRSYFIYNHEKVESVDYTKDTVADPEGTVYFGLNTASGGKYYPVADGEWYTNVAIQTYVPNYTVVDVREDRVSFRTYRTDSDEAIDTYTVIQTLDKQPQNAPAGLSGQRPASEGAKGRIIGTSDGMEYSMDGQVWQSCGDGYTELAPGVYYVRYKGNASFFAGAAVSVTVPVYSSGTGEPEDPQPGPVILTVYDGDTPKKEFTQSDLDRMAQVTNPYSAVNTWPAYSEFYGVTGIPLMSLFAMAGVNPSDEQEIRFYATDGFYTTLKMSDLTAPRYYFDSNGNRGAAVPPVISQGDNGWSLYFGQRTAREQIRQAYVDRLERIVIGAYADQWGSVIADPVSGSTVKAGDPIRLILPPGSGDAKIYYTLDGSEPTIYSTMYNETADRWFSQKGISENPPIETPAGIDALTVSARIIGIGRSDGEIMEFHYVVSESAAGGNPDETGGTGGTGGFGSLSAPGTVILNANAVPLAEAGSAAVSFTVDDLRERIEEAVSGEANGVLALEINTADYTTSVAATLPAESVKTMIDKGLSILTISSGLGSNSFDLAALQSMYAQGEGDSFELVIRIVDVSTLSKELQEVVEGRLLYQIEVLRNGKPITSFGAGRVMTRIPYTLPPGRSGYGIRVWYLSTEGELSEVECEYNRIQSYIQFMWNRLAYYMIDYDEEKAAAALAANPFEDVAEGAWYYDVVLYAYTRNLMTGTSAEPMLFSPNASLTRGMAVSILHRLAGGDTGYPGSFKDVAADRWYADAVNWAAAKGIVAGYGDGRFGPDDSITREQFAAILRNYADYLHIDTVDSGYQPAVYSIPANYTDAGEVSAWAMDAMRWANGQGLINGRTLNTLAPKDTATRAEAAAIFQRFLEGMSEDS